MRHIISSLYFSDYNKNGLANIPDMHVGEFIADAGTARIGNQMAVKFYKSHHVEIVSHHFGRKIEHYGIIYIKRHPLDVFLSHLNYLLRADVGRHYASSLIVPGKSVEDMVANGSIEYFLDVFILFGTVDPAATRTKNNWFRNMKYWTQKDAIQQGGRAVPVACLKYEDMVQNPVKAMQPLCDMLGQSKQQLREALLVANEKTKVDGEFFWKQKHGLYKDMLSEDLIARFKRHHGERVAALGYEI